MIKGHLTNILRIFIGKDLISKNHLVNLNEGKLHISDYSVLSHVTRVDLK